jgi:hypothetical protein
VRCIIRRVGAIQAECLSLNACFCVVDPLKYDTCFDVNFARELWLFVVTVGKPGTDQVTVLVKRMLYFKTKVKILRMVCSNTVRRG